MKYLLTIAILAICSSYSYSQTPAEIEEQYANSRKAVANKTQIQTLTLDLTGVPKNNQGALKDDFTFYKKRVVSIDYDEFNETMIIKYSGLSEEKITSLLNKYQVNNSAIINE